MSQRVSGYQRVPGDHYPTPEWVVRVAAQHLRQLGSRRIWTPADDHSSKLVCTLRAEGFSVVASCDNFLSRERLPELTVDSILTNPPFGSGGRLACQFVEHALALVPVTVMLLRVDFDSGRTRTHLFRDNPSFAGKITLLDRITWFEREGAAGPSENHAWFIWNARHRGPPTIKYARKPKSVADHSGERISAQLSFPLETVEAP